MEIVRESFVAKVTKGEGCQLIAFEDALGAFYVLERSFRRDLQ